MFPSPTAHERSAAEVRRRLVPNDHQHVLEMCDRYGVTYRAAHSKRHVQQLLARRLEHPAPALAGTGPASQAALRETMEHVVTQVSWPDESKYRPGMVVEVPAAAFGETYAAEHASETFTGTLLDVHRVEDGAILWNVRYGDGDCVTDEAFFDEEDEPDDERANVCACCGGTTVTATGEPMERVLVCENDACRAVIHYDDGDRETITFPDPAVRVTRRGPKPAPEPEAAAVSCPICLDMVSAATTFRFACSHIICGECCSTLAKVAMEDSIAQRSGVKVACPICRRPERLALPAGVL